MSGVVCLAGVIGLATGVSLVALFWERRSVWMRRSNFESMRSTVFSRVVIRELKVCFVVIERLDAEEAELVSSLLFLAFLFASVAISDGGARFELNVETESLSVLSFF